MPADIFPGSRPACGGPAGTVPAALAGWRGVRRTCMQKCKQAAWQCGLSRAGWTGWWAGSPETEGSGTPTLEQGNSAKVPEEHCPAVDTGHSQSPWVPVLALPTGWATLRVPLPL